MAVFVLNLEPIDTRYTGQWQKGLPKEIMKESGKIVIPINGGKISSVTTEGAFLNFLDTNLWKNTQINKLVEMFKNKEVEPGDHILFPDGWHTGILQIKYISELLNIPVKIHAIWHAGSYDPNDFLGRLIKDKNWTFNAERAMMYACDYNYVSTEYHKDLIESELFFDMKSPNIIVSGLPFEYLWKTLKPYSQLPKRNLILFPHRIAPEKQVEIFKDLAGSFPDYEFVVCQEQKLTKDQYHQLLGESKMVFSANLQETLGISCIEAIICNSIPFVPDRLSYREMYDDVFKYPSRYTDSWEKYLENKDLIVKQMQELLEAYDLTKEFRAQSKKLKTQFCFPAKMYNNLCL